MDWANWDYEQIITKWPVVPLAMIVEGVVKIQQERRTDADKDTAVAGDDFRLGDLFNPQQSGKGIIEAANEGYNRAAQETNVSDDTWGAEG